MPDVVCPPVFSLGATVIVFRLLCYVHFPHKSKHFFCLGKLYILDRIYIWEKQIMVLFFALPQMNGLFSPSCNRMWEFWFGTWAVLRHRRHRSWLGLHRCRRHILPTFTFRHLNSDNWAPRSAIPTLGYEIETN